MLRQSQQDTIKWRAHRWTAAVPATQESPHISHICTDYDHPIHKYYLLFVLLVDYQCTSVTKGRTKTALMWQVIRLFRTFDFAMMIFYMIEISNNLYTIENLFSCLTCLIDARRSVKSILNSHRGCWVSPILTSCPHPHQALSNTI